MTQLLLPCAEERNLLDVVLGLLLWWPMPKALQVACPLESCGAQVGEGCEEKTAQGYVRCGVHSARKRRARR